jgi:hypothetical protein
MYPFTSRRPPSSLLYHSSAFRVPSNFQGYTSSPYFRVSQFSGLHYFLAFQGAANVRAIPLLSISGCCNFRSTQLLNILGVATFEETSLYRDKKAVVEKVSTPPGHVWSHVKLKFVLKSYLSRELGSRQTCGKCIAKHPLNITC